MDGDAQDPGGEGAVVKLYLALGIVPKDVVAFVGAGGKSSAIQVVADELAEAGMTFLTAPTTKMLVSETKKLGTLITSENPGELRSKAEQTLSDGASGVVVGSGLLSKNRVGGVRPETIPSLAPLADVVLVEADGSRRRPIKGTADHEPALPDAVTLVVAVGNIRAFGAPLVEEYVHRPELFSKLTGIGAGQSITARAFARALAQGSLGKTPEDARTAALITGVHPGKSMADASVITRELWRFDVKKVVLTSLPDESPPRVWMP
jgi:probable selenium-dependent hydroxylase accessory protein YqeC